MSQLVITIGGLPNSGKSTVSAILAERLDQTVRIELDQNGVGHVVTTLTQEERKALRDRDTHVEIEDAATLAVNWLERGFDVILVGLLNEGATTGIRRILDSRISDLKYVSFGLTPSLETVLGPRGSRIPNEQQQEFTRSIATWYVPNGELIDNAGQTPEETASEMQEILSRTW